MPSSTFEHLSEKKKNTIILALLHEFSKVSLSKAQVAPIVKEAEIARGAFYKYFSDLTDAYIFLYKLAMKDIHTPFISKSDQTADAYVQQTRDFLTNTQKSKYYDLIRMHILHNEHHISTKPMSPDVSPLVWAVAELCHATIRESMSSPDKQDKYLKQLYVVLTKLLEN
ncbi:TetR/AcrR family transcriptional regulator [Ligilactobacillus salivarius]|uniref:TetR/AcrR family transcriptional regulator n=1 Tax=Ligilactobacillus salivarius TaxID=1624 RepID=UPI00236298EF|nr:TetR/AcrR family transcriptional regulator [Ligilactobacillus salivarius]MDD1402334.1 TetR/AcrR family transcriptional regulator [Ligilactobacillus salivarius]